LEIKKQKSIIRDINPWRAESNEVTNKQRKNKTKLGENIHGFLWLSNPTKIIKKKELAQFSFPFPWLLQNSPPSPL
jgi:hypothetical protein